MQLHIKLVLETNEARADFIITYNQKDLLAAEKFGIRVVTPKEFLQHVGEIS